MFDRLKGKTVMVTGASSGIGASCARLFAEVGSNLILTARRTDRLAALAAEIRSKYPQVQVYTAELDVRNRADVDRVVSELPAEFSAIDVLSIDTVLDTNVKGLLYVTRAVVRGMRARGSGHVIMMGSIAGLTAYPTGSIYCASKYAVHAIAQSLRAETLDVPIKVTEINPGMVETEFSIIRKTMAIKRRLTNAVVFAASRHQRCVVSDVVLLATGQYSPTVAHRKE
ncbi:short-chain dehydrogenase/reductase SDR [Linderina pennispora]|uniref:Short-chain dehydrogenase/reductase SDR n=1 Tax=Linderina pennispora TaxID=61395 RepID=A0A1Y1VS57_9FUNG|nr:short-chain dehydrogenase/reductase SDR [Linderina pennispora]ORX63875.1 short-chain dehydrogenase/reductase SDR [Linderina pennispora]